MRVILAILIGCVSITSNAQNHKIWFTYAVDNFVFSPGFEADFNIMPKIGFRAGVSGYYHDYELNQITNIEYGDRLGFYNTHIGASYDIWNKEGRLIELSAGCVMHFAPDYSKTYFYEPGGYYIYSDRSNYKPEFGPNFGVSYTQNKITASISFDLSRHNWRFGLGIPFGRKR